MKIKYLLIIVFITVLTKSSFAQYAQDAVRFSTFQTGSTSRIKAIGNAGTAIGGDLSSISGNPAGIGFFTHSELSITPEFDASNIKSTYFGQPGSDHKNSLNLSNAAIVFYQRLNTPRGSDKNKGWLSLNYGAAYSRTNNFYENITYGGANTSSSISDYYASTGNDQVAKYGSLNPDGLDGWGYNQNLIDNYGTDANPHYQSNVALPASQLNNTTRTGGQSELDFSMGANYCNKLYIGLGVAITDVRYNAFNSFGEAGTASILQNGTPANVNFNSFYTQNQNTTGSGLNAKLGIIYKPLQALRLGFVFTTPTYYSIDDSYNEAMQTRFAGSSTVSNGLSQPYELNYNMRTPLKIAGGAAIFMGKYGFITGDAEYVDYSATHISSSDSYSADFDNSQIKSLYRSVVNIHTGAEINLNSIVYLRGGYSLQSSPMKSNGSNITTYTGGLGFRFDSYYVDVTYAHINGKQTVFPYETGSTSPYANLNKTNNNGFITLGYTF